MNITDQIIREYKQFKNDNDRYPSRIAVGSKAYLKLSAELLAAYTDGFMRNMGGKSYEYEAVPISEDKNLGEFAINMT